jgi:hypothetical protein
MAKRRGTTEGTTGDRNGSHLLSVGLLVGSIGGALILGAALENDAPSGEKIRAGRVVGQPLPDTRPTPPPPPAPEPADPSVSRVEVATLRAERDLERVTDSAGSWTAQLALLCDAARVGRIVDEYGSMPELYVLPAYHDDKACFLVCWGLYDRADGARSAAGLPSSLRSALSDPYPKRLTDVFEGLR